MPDTGCGADDVSEDRHIGGKSDVTAARPIFNMDNMLHELENAVDVVLALGHSEGMLDSNVVFTAAETAQERLATLRTEWKEAFRLTHPRGAA